MSAQVTFYPNRLRRPAIVEVGYGYRHDGALRVFKASVDDLLLFDRPETEVFGHIIGHLEEAA